MLLAGDLRWVAERLVHDDPVAPHGDLARAARTEASQGEGAARRDALLEIAERLDATDPPGAVVDVMLDRLKPNPTPVPSWAIPAGTYSGAAVTTVDVSTVDDSWAGGGAGDAADMATLAARTTATAGSSARWTMARGTAMALQVAGRTQPATEALGVGSGRPVDVRIARTCLGRGCPAGRADVRRERRQGVPAVDVRHVDVAVVWAGRPA